MLSFFSDDKKIYTLTHDIESIEKKTIELNLISSSVTNKYNIITSFVESLSTKFGPEFDSWFVNFLQNFENNPEDRFNIMEASIPEIKRFCSLYLASKEYDFSEFVSPKKSKKGTILFTEDEIYKIIQISMYLKIYSFIFNNSDFKFPHSIHKKIYNQLVSEVLCTDIVSKIFDIVKTKTYRYSITDKYMWEYVKMVQCKTIDMHVIELFNFITNSILVLCEEDRNPIIYFTTVIDESMKWFLRSIYKSSIIYEDSVSTENLNSLVISNLNTYCYNDTLGRLKGLAYENLYKKIENTFLIDFTDESVSRVDDKIVEIQDRLKNIQHVSPLAECLTYPILSKITKIPYEYFKTLSCGDSCVLSAYLFDIFKRIPELKNNYKNIFSILECYPTKQPSLSTTYTLKSVQKYINTFNESESVFFGFQTKILPYNILSFFVGRIIRTSFVNIETGTKLSTLQTSKFEEEFISLYHLIFSDNFSKELLLIEKQIRLDF